MPGTGVPFTFEKVQQKILKLCMTHWDALRKAVHDLGLSGLAQANADEFVHQLSTGSEEDISIMNFDPLLFANLAIIINAKNNGLDPTKDTGCPICKLNAEPWIQRAAEDALNAAHQLMKRYKKYH